MFCPKCGAKNLEDAKFCRACGADIHLVPRALAGSLPEAAGKKEKKAKEPPTLEKGFENVFGGIACLVIFVLGLTYFPGYFWISVWFIIPGLEHVGKGIGQIIRARQNPRALDAAAEAGALTAARPDALPAPTTNMLADAGAAPGAPTNEIAPPSVTESTTRSLGAEPRRASGGARRSPA